MLCSDGSGVEGEGEVRGRGRQQRKRRGGGRNSIGKHVKRRRGRRGVENDEEQDSMMEDTSSVVELSQSEKNAFISDMAKVRRPLPSYSIHMTSTCYRICYSSVSPVPCLPVRLLGTS